MTNGENSKGVLVRIGDRVSDWGSRLFAHPGTQIGVIALCIIWFGTGLPTDLLTATLSILAITLTQMVLNGQYDREVDDHRRDVAMHAKLDELLIAMKGARDEMAGIEELDEEDITELKEHVDAAIVTQGKGGNHRTRAAAMEAVDTAGDRISRRKKAATKG